MVSTEKELNWNPRDVRIVTDKYITPQDEQYAEKHGLHPIEAMIERVTTTIASHATQGHLETARVASKEELANKLFNIVRDQKAIWNSPVLFNVGLQEKPQCWACLILSVDDSMESIKSWWNNEIDCFLGGSGSGANVSAIRADGERLSGGRGRDIASGPVSFMRAADSIAGTIKSGGRTRRAAKMVVLDADHPDVEEFIESKSRVEGMKNLLAEAGYDMSLNGKDSLLMQYQNANNSVRVTDNFMERVRAHEEWNLKYRLGGTAKVVNAHYLWRKIAQAAWDCADPGVQFHDNVNKWHTVPSRGEIVASNPCSEYMSVNDSVCNLASLNLKNFFTDNLETKDLIDTVRTMIVSMDIIVDMSSYPNEEIEKNSRGLRNLGLGSTNIGALLMSRGIPYDCVEARSIAAAIHSLVMATAVRTSAELAHYEGPHNAWQDDKDTHFRVLQMHSSEAKKWSMKKHSGLWSEVDENWTTALDLAQANGQRNSQLTVIAPTGTISFPLGAETTGIEPVMAIYADKELVGGGSIDVSAQECVKQGLESAKRNELYPDLALDKTDVELISNSPIFATAVGENKLSPEAHLNMMAAVQPSISGAISKTVNMPADCTVEDVASIYMKAWELGLKSVAIYRDSSKGDQPVRERKATVPEVVIDYTNNLTEEILGVKRQENMPNTRQALTHKFTIDNQDFYLTAGYYPDGGLGEVFLRASAQGSFISGMLDSYAIAISLGLQHGVKPETYAEHFIHQSYEPHGVVMSDSEIKMARSVVDYVWRWLTTERGNGNTEKPIVATNGVSEVGSSYVRQCPECTALALEFSGTCLTCKACGYSDGGCE